MSFFSSLFAIKICFILAFNQQQINNLKPKIICDPQKIHCNYNNPFSWQYNTNKQFFQLGTQLFDQISYHSRLLLINFKTPTNFQITQKTRNPVLRHFLRYVSSCFKFLFSRKCDFPVNETEAFLDSHFVIFSFCCCVYQCVNVSMKILIWDINRSTEQLDY